MGRVTRRPLARDDAVAIWRYVATDDEIAADTLIDRIDDRLRLLAGNPMLGRARTDLMADLRGFVVGNYVIYYRPIEDGIEVVRLLHGARDASGQVLD